VIALLEKDSERQYNEYQIEREKALARAAIMAKQNPPVKVPIPRQPAAIKRIQEACTILSTRPSQKTLDDWLIRLEDMIIEEDRAKEAKSKL
jgi:hypothetical protein